MSTARIITVSNQAELLSALNNRTADTTIVLKPGEYGTVVYNANESPLGIKLVAADADNPPKFSGVTIANANGVSIEGIQFAPTGDTNFSSALLLRNCEDVTLTNNAFVGNPNSFTTQQRGLTIDGSSNIVVQDNDFSGLMRGGVFSSSTNLKIVNNNVTNQRSEGFNFAGVQNVEIAYNTMSDFHPMEGDHPDFIQFWTGGVKMASENINIHHNTLIQEAPGLSVQGIFMGNDANIPYKNVVIADNVINSGMPHGIMLLNAVGATVTNNVATPVESSKYKMHIGILQSEDVVVVGNTSSILTLTGSEVTEQSNNTQTAPQASKAPAPAPVGNPEIRGTDGGDKLSGTGGDDTIIGGAGNDTILGGRGDDLIIGGAGDDILYGSVGADTFQFSATTLNGRETDSIYDLKFEEGDRIELVDFDFAGVNTLPASMLKGGSDQSGIVLTSAADLVMLSQLAEVTVSRHGKTEKLIMTVHDSDDTLEVMLPNLYTSYVAAGGQFI